jgi:hypothetical protein
MTEPEIVPLPENTDTPPEFPLSEFPVPIAIFPLSATADDEEVDPVRSEASPDENLESAVDNLIAPERKTSLTPVEMLMKPPDFLSEELSPAISVMPPPSPVPEEPTTSETSPDLLLNPSEEPVEIKTEPLGPPLLAPVEKTAEPLLYPPKLAPVCKSKLPPSPLLDTPAFIFISPPRPACPSELPAEIDTEPPELRELLPAATVAEPPSRVLLRPEINSIEPPLAAEPA